MSVIIRERERDRERDYDDRSSTTYRRDPGGYTTVKRYRVPAEREEPVEPRRTIVYSTDRDRERLSDRDRGEDRGFEETRIIRRERTPEPEPERRVERDIRIERIEREREPEPPQRFAEYRYERDIDRLAPRRDPYELERYSRSTEYFPRPDPPQPIIIRQEPQQIIIQEAPRTSIVVPAPQPPTEADFQLIQRSEVVDDHRSVVSKATTKRTEKPQRDEEYYYERRVREVKGDDRDDDFYEERHNRRREVSPGDSVSQVGHRRGRDREYSSDDSMVYVRRETREAYDREESPDHKRHLAEGAIAGIGAAELLRHHRSKQGEEVSGTGGRLAKDLGAAGLGAVAATGISRARSHHREKSRRRRSRSRSRSSSRDTYRESRRRERRRKSRSRSRSGSRSRVKQLAGLGLGAAAVAGAVAYANRKNKANKAEQEDRRSRSRTRRSVSPDDKEIPEDDPRNPSHRNKKIAQAGAAGAAVAALVERARSKSRGPQKGRERSKSRVRQGLPIAAAGLGTAAIAGLYERSQANKNEKQDEEQAKVLRKERREARRQARSRSRSVPYEGSRDAGAGLIEYGDQPVYTAGGQDYYNRPASQHGFHSPDAMVPAAAAGAAYGGHRDRDRERRRSSSSSGSDSRTKRRHRRKKSRSRSRDRGKDLAAAGLAAGAGAVAASEYEKRRQRKHEKRERRRQEELREQAAFDESYPPQAQQQFSPISPAPNPQAAQEAGFAPGTYYPPNANNFAQQPGSQGYSPQPAAYPQQYPPPTGAQPQQAQLSPEYGYPQQTGYTPPVTGNPYDPPAADPYGQQPGGRTRRADENVSAAPVFNTPSAAAKRYVPEEGVKPPRAPSPPLQPGQPRSSSQPPPANKSVQFNLDPASSGLNSPAQIRKRRQRAGSSARNPYLDPSADQTNGTNVSDATLVNSDRPSRHRRHRRARSRDDVSRSPSPAPSDATIDLPERFDQYGRKKPEKGDDPLADKIEEFLTGKGKGGKWLSKLMGEDDEEDNAGADDVGGREYRDREKRRRRRNQRG